MAVPLSVTGRTHLCPINNMSSKSKFRRTADFHPTVWGNHFLNGASVSSISLIVRAHSCLASNTSTLSDVRRTADFHPTIWGDYFLKYASQSSIMDDKTEKHFEQQKEEVKKILSATKLADQTLELVDTIQRLGFSYHFEDEISDILRRIKNIPEDEFQNDSLHITSLRFRLLRQEGYNISTDIFKRFTNHEGKLKDELTSDVKGMLSLYEASHLMVNGELILEEALSFTTRHLQSSVASSPNLGAFLATQVKRALERPILKGMPRVEARYFISIYHEDPSHSELLLNFAKLDFNIVQKCHQMELGELTTWHKGLGLESKLPYFRDRFPECYFTMMGICFEPKFSLSRKILVKVSYILLVIDDTFDVYGKIDELRAFAKAVHSWNIKCLDQLPEYMKCIYKALLDIYDEIEESMEREDKGSYRIKYAKHVAKEFIQAYLDEAEWVNKNYVPTMEEYMEHSLITSAQCIFSVTSFLGMGNVATEEVFEWSTKYPKIIRAGSVITRLMDDMAGHKFEQKRGHIASSVECYMKQYGVTEEETYKVFQRRISDAWKDMMEEWIDPTRVVPLPILTRMINFTRVVDNVYKTEDTFTHSWGLMKTLIKSLYVDPVPM